MFSLPLTKSVKKAAAFHRATPENRAVSTASKSIPFDALEAELTDQLSEVLTCRANRIRLAGQKPSLRPLPARDGGANDVVPDVASFEWLQADEQKAERTRSAFLGRTWLEKAEREAVLAKRRRRTLVMMTLVLAAAAVCWVFAKSLFVNEVFQIAAAALAFLGG